MAIEHAHAVVHITSKSDPRYKLYVSGCMTKKWFSSKDDVVKFLAERNYNKNLPKNLYAYKCKFCDGWHFTSTKMYAPEKLKKCFSKQHLVARRLSDNMRLDTFTPDSWGWAKTKKLLAAMLDEEKC